MEFMAIFQRDRFLAGEMAVEFIFERLPLAGHVALGVPGKIK
jgi:hypothetical protein